MTFIRNDEGLKDVSHILDPLNNAFEQAAEMRAKQIEDAINQALTDNGYIFDTQEEYHNFLLNNTTLVHSIILNKKQFVVNGEVLLEWLDTFDYTGEGYKINFYFG